MLALKVNGIEFPLPVLPAEERAALQNWYDNGKYPELVNPLAVNCATPHDPERKVGSLFWPVAGASRFAHAVLPIDYYTLGQVREQMDGPVILDENGDPVLDEDDEEVTGEANNRVTVVFRDDPTEDAYLLDEAGEPLLDEDDQPIESEESREFPMFSIASRPVSRTSSDGPPATEPEVDDLWLITLVDRRWYWVHELGTGASLAPQSWSDLYTALFSHVLDGDSPSIEPTPSAYGDPSDRWEPDNCKNLSSAYLLDDAAYRTGARILVHPEGVAVQRPSAALRLNALAWVEADRLGGGGEIDDDDTWRGLPATVFSGDEEVTLATGVTGARMSARLDTEGDATALAQWASDWRDWERAPLDAVFDGFMLPPGSAFVGSVELYHDAIIGYTRAQRAPINWQPVLDCWQTPEETGTCEPGCGWVAGLQDTDCLLMTVVCGITEQTLLLTWDTDAWVSASSLTTPANSGTVRVWIETGEAHASVNGLELIRGFCQGDGAYFTGGPGTGHGVSTSGSCDGATFTIRVECTPCTLDPDPPTDPVCCTTGIPVLLYACRQTGCNNAFGCDDTAVVLEPTTIGSGQPQFPMSGCATPCSDPRDGHRLCLSLNCIGSVWKLTATCWYDGIHTATYEAEAQVGWDCDPFDMTFSFPAMPGCCPDASTWRLTAAPCAPTETSYDCISGTCVETPGGAYSSSQACIDAGCGSAGTECCVSEPATLRLTFSGDTDPPCTAGVNDLPDRPVLFSQMSAGVWNSEEFIACAVCQFVLACDGGLWSISPGGCSTYFDAFSLVSAQCSPFVVVFETQYRCGACNVPVTLTFTE